MIATVVRRVAVVGVLGAVAVFGAANPSAATSSPTGIGIGATTATFDHAAVFLAPAAFPLPGLVASSSRLEDAAAYADGFVNAEGPLQTLLANGFRGRYVRGYTVSSSDPDRPSVHAETFVAEYRDAEAAAAVFSEFENDYDFVDSVDVQFPTFGDQSELSVTDSTDDDGQPFTILEFTAQDDNAVVSFTIFLYARSGLDESDLASDDLEATAASLLERLGAARLRTTGGFYSAPRFVGIEGISGSVANEGYQFLDGTFYPDTAVESDPEPVPPVDVYYVQSFLDTSVDGPTLAALVELFAYSDAGTAAWEATRPWDAEQAATEGFLDAAPTMDPAFNLPGVSVQRAYTYDFDLGGGEVAPGIRYRALVDNYVLEVSFDSASELDPESASRAMGRAVDCVRSGGCAAIELDDSMLAG